MVSGGKDKTTTNKTKTVLVMHNLYWLDDSFGCFRFTNFQQKHPGIKIRFILRNPTKHFRINFVASGSVSYLSLTFL